MAPNNPTFWYLHLCNPNLLNVSWIYGFTSFLSFFFFYFFIEFIGMTLVNCTSGVQFYNTSSVYCIVFSPSQVKSPSITIYPYTLFYLHPVPFLESLLKNRIQQL